MADLMEEIPVAQAVTTHLVEAARLLEQALKAGSPDPQAAYMVALCYKGMGKTADARNALRKIREPDANVFLQMGLLSFAEKAFAEAEREFAKSLELDSGSYAAAYNLMLARLCQGQMETCAAMVPELAALAPPGEQRFLSTLEALLDAMPKKNPQPEQRNGAPDKDAILAEVTQPEEQRLVQVLAGLGQFDVAYPLLKRFAAVRPDSAVAQAAYLEVALLQAKALADKADWDAAKELLAPLARLAADGMPRATQIALLNLLGVACCM